MRPDVVRSLVGLAATTVLVACGGASNAAPAPAPDTGQWQHGLGSYDDIVKTITNGVPQVEIKDPTHRFNMRARGGVQPLLTDDEVKAVAAYVWSLSHSSQRCNTVTPPTSCTSEMVGVPSGGGNRYETVPGSSPNCSSRSRGRARATEGRRA